MFTVLSSITVDSRATLTWMFAIIKHRKNSVCLYNEFLVSFLFTYIWFVQNRLSRSHSSSKTITKTATPTVINKKKHNTLLRSCDENNIVKSKREEKKKKKKKCGLGERSLLAYSSYDRHMADLAANRKLILELSRAHQVQLHPAALNALVVFAKSVANGGLSSSQGTPLEDKETALRGLFACLTDVISDSSSMSISSGGSGGGVSAPSSSSSSSRHVSADNVSSAISRFYTVAGIKMTGLNPVASTSDQKGGVSKGDKPSSSSSSGAGTLVSLSSSSVINVTARLQVVPPAVSPYGLVDPHSGGVTLYPNANAAASATGTFLRADRQFALTQRYLAALGRCHRSGLYRKGVGGGGVGAGGDKRPCLVPISSLEGLPDHVETALLGILQFATLADGSGSGTATDNVGGLGSTAVGWRLEDPRATIPLLFPPNFDSGVSLLGSSSGGAGAAPIIVSGDEEEEDAYVDPASPTTLMRTAGLGAPSRRVGFLLKGACVVAMGKWTPDGYLVKRLELPPGETREVTLSTQNGLDTFGLAPHDAVRAKAAEAAAVDDVIIFISRVHLDKSSVHYNLSKLFGALKERSNEELSSMTFVLVGDFSSKAVASTDVSHFSETSRSTNANNNATSVINDPTSPFINGREGFAALFDQLASTITAAASNVAQHGRFVFVPGPRDLSLLRGVVPQPQIPLSGVLSGFMKKCPHTTSTSNPCRLRFLTKEIVIAQSDFYQSLRAESFHVNTTVHGSFPLQTTAASRVVGGGASFPTVLHEAAAAQKHLKRLNAIHVDDDDVDNAAGIEGGGGSLKQKEQAFEHVVKTIVDHAHLFPAVPSSAAAVLSSTATTLVGNVGGLMGNASSAGAATGVSSANPLLASAKTATSSSSIAMQKNIVWAQDHLLKLSPLPHFLLLCDQTLEWSCTYRGCRVLNPGCFSSTSSFVWFTPSDGEITFNTL